MANQDQVTKAVEHALEDVFEARMASLRQTIAQEVIEAVMPLVEAADASSAGLAAAEKRAAGAEKKVEELKTALADAESKAANPRFAPGTAPTDILFASVASIYDAEGQADILRNLLDGIAQSNARAALFVAKGGNLTGWQCRGFADDGAVKGMVLSGSSGLAGRAMQDKEPVSAAAAEFSSQFISTNGNPVDGNALVLPLVVRDKVAAIIYTDAGTSTPGTSDTSAARVLVRSAASWLEILALRKMVGGAVEAAADAAAAAAEPPPAPVAAPPPPPPAAAPTPSSASSGADLAGLSPEDQELHKKAKRFAKLLVDEIKLYNQAKVTEGRANKDIYKRLQEDIDKSRATYEKRYGSTSAASANYFAREVVRILADNDPALLGGGFPQ
ncbi:MAG: hypothetical protein HYX26_06885 [Acidobacteriales bacterium]|nr:hypothetical protein [Terriglobales bacterium]